MNKWLKRVLIFLGVLLLIVGGAGLYIQIDGIPKYEVQKISMKVDLTPARIERGHKIASMLCQGCHLNQTTGALTGHRLLDVPKEFGTVYSRNITSDPEYGIGTWTDGEIAYLLRTGIKRDGQYAPPYMPKLPHISDEDLASIIAFLRSNDSLVRPMQVADTASSPSFLVKLLCHVAFKPFKYPTAVQTAPAVTDQVAYGKYIVQNVNHCFQCHSKDFKTNDELNPEKSDGYMGGGNELLDANGKHIYSANLTMDTKTGIGNWTEAQFIRAVKEGFTPDNRLLRYPMERLPEMTDQEVADIFAYLKTLPVQHTEKKESEVFAVAATANAGQKIYYKYNCTSCHGETGVGSCDLTHAHDKYKTNADLTAWIRNPSQFQPNSKMPTWNGVIQDNEYEALCNYVRLLGEKSTQAPSKNTISMR